MKQQICGICREETALDCDEKRRQQASRRTIIDYRADAQDRLLKVAWRKTLRVASTDLLSSVDRRAAVGLNTASLSVRDYILSTTTNAVSDGRHNAELTGMCCFLLRPRYRHSTSVGTDNLTDKNFYIHVRSASVNVN